MVQTRWLTGKNLKGRLPPAKLSDALPGGLPEPNRQDHKLRGHLLPEEVVSSLPGDSPQENPQGSPCVCGKSAHSISGANWVGQVRGGVELHWWKV